MDIKPSFQQPQKDFPQDFTEIEADALDEGIDLIAAFAQKPVAWTNRTVVFAVADDRFDRDATLLALF